ncbi:MAG TPA: hypothetical protein VJI70_00095 [Candidatus Paceibacterota bacterium]
MNKYQIAVIVGFIFFAVFVYYWLTKVVPFLEGLVWLKDDKIRANFEFNKNAFKPKAWPPQAKDLLNEVHQLMCLAVLCGFNARNRVAMTEDLVRREVELITERELQRALLDAQRELVSAAKSGLFDGNTLTGLSWESFERVKIAYRGFEKTADQLVNITPTKEADMERFKKSFLELARIAG